MRLSVASTLIAYSILIDLDSGALIGGESAA